MRRKEERSKQGETNNKAKQHSTPKAHVIVGNFCISYKLSMQHSFIIERESEHKKQTDTA